MYDLARLEACYKKFINDMPKWLPEDIITIDVNILHRFNLLHFYDPEYHDPTLTRYFHVIESEEKITLINDEFAVWIVPERVGDITITYTLIATNHPKKQPQLQLCYLSSGIYNTSRLVLRVLEKFLQEIEENEKIIKEYEKGA